MAIESRIEGDLSGQNTNSQSRIEQILNGEQITPRSRIEQLLQEYNPEDPGDYHKVECTKAQYDNMPSHSSSTIYVVTYPDQSVHFYLGDEEIEGEPVLITKTITENDTYNASDDNADGYSSVTVNVPSVTPTLIEKSITENGIYDAEDEGADGYSIVEVDVEGSSYTFKGHVALSFPTGGDGGAYIPETKLGLDTSKDFEIIVCVWIGANYTLPSSTIFELIGTGSYDVRRKYPQLEFDNRGIWYAASSNDGASWDQSGTISASDVSSFLIQGSYNYLKLKYSVTEAKLSVWHSSDGETFTKKGEISTPNGISNTTSYPMAFGNTALLRDDRAPFSDDFYIAFDKCKIISEGTVIYGGKLVEELPSNIEALEYIKSTGNSVILTDIVPNYNWDVFFDLKMENLVSTGAYEILGINYPTEHFLMTFPWYSGYNTIDYIAWAGFTPSSGDTYGVTGKISVQDEANKQNTAIMRRGNGGCIFGKHNYTMTNRTDDATPTHPIVISGIDEGGTIYPYSRGELTIYGIRIFNEYSVLIHNFIPAQNKTTNRAGLYDIVTGVFYPSSSSFSDFTKGPVAKGIPQVDATLTTKSITANGTYNASSDNADGYSSVTVNVPINMEIVPYGTLYADSYIKRDTGAVGSYSGDTATDFIEIDPDNYYYMFGGKLQPSQGQRWDPTCNAYYDSNKQYISGFSLSLSQGSMDPSTVTSNFLEFPSTAKYIRISQATEAFSDFKTFILKIRKSYVNPNA